MLVTRRIFAVAVFAAVLIAGWRFASDNSTTVTVSYWIGEFTEVALWLALAVAFGGGALLVGLVAAYELAKAGLVARRYRQTVAELEDELHQLRNLPLAAEEAARSDDAVGAVVRGAGSGLDR
jgi:uncharacterized integral membrane protein